MSDDLVAAYSETRRQFVSAKKEVEQLIDFLKRKVAVLSKWQEVTVTGAKTQCRPEQAAQTREEVTIAASGWPSADRLAEVLGKVHEAHLAMKKAYENVPQDIRECLQEPLPL